MSPVARSLARMLVVAGLALSADPAQAIIYNWNNPAGGAATTLSYWTPNGVPYIGDMAVFGVPAIFPVSWTAPADTMDFLWVTQGNPSFTIASRLGLTSGLAIRGVSSLTLASGTIWASGCYANYSDLGQMIVDGVGSEVDAGYVDFGCFGGGVSRIDVADGGRLFSRGQIHLAYDASEQFAGTIHHRIRSGFPFIYHYPVIYTLKDDYGNAPDCVIGGHGSASLDVYDGGYLNTIGRLFLGTFADGSGTLHCYPGGGAASGVTSNGETWIGANPQAGAAGGAGTVALEGSFSYFTGPCWLGDPDDAPGGPVTKLLQVDNGALTVFAGGINMTPALTSRFDVIGGDTHVIGGPLVIRQVAPFEIGSAGGHSPTLWLENGTTSDFWPTITGTPALGVARGGNGTLNVVGAGTAALVHGRLAVADSAGGYAAVRVDSAATFTVQGPATVGGYGYAVFSVLHPGTTVTFQDSVYLGPNGQLISQLSADSSAVVHLQKPLVMDNGGGLLVYDGAQADVAGLTLGVHPGQGYEVAEVGSANAALMVSDHCDVVGSGWLAVDTAGVFTYTPTAHAMTVGSPAVPSGRFTINDGGRAQIASELDVRGWLDMEPSPSLNVLSPPTSRIRRTTIAGPQRQLASPWGNGGRLEAPLVRLLGTSRSNAVGTIAARLHIDSGVALLAVSPNDLSYVGHLIAGDSTKSDGFVSVGTITIGLDTLKVLDSDGGDLGKMTIAGGDLQLPKPGHLKSGFLLSGNGTVEGSLDVRDSAWVSLLGTVTGDVALAGTLDLNRPPFVLAAPAGAEAIRALSLGSLHVAPTGLLAVQIGSAGQDQITVSGAAVLGGTLDVRTLDGEAPTIGSLFTVLTASSISGTFASVTVNGHPNPGTVTVLYGSTNVRVAVVGAIAGVGDEPAGSALPVELRFAAMGGPRDAALALDLPTTASVRVSLYDVSGRQVATLADGELGAGRHRFEIVRATPASGMYFARAVVTDADRTHALTTRVVVLR